MFDNYSALNERFIANGQYDEPEDIKHWRLPDWNP
jgi:hypothetical protein